MKQDKIVSGFFGLLNSQFVNVGDWVIAIAFTLYGMYGFILTEPTLSHYVSIVLGLIGFVAAIKKPSKLLEKKIKKSVIKK